MCTKYMKPYGHGNYFLTAVFYYNKLHTGSTAIATRKALLYDVLQDLTYLGQELLLVIIRILFFYIKRSSFFC